MEKIIGICDQCSGIVVRNSTSQGYMTFCKSCGKLPELKVEKILREDVVSDRTLLISNPVKDNILLE